MSEEEITIDPLLAQPSGGDVTAGLPIGTTLSMCPTCKRFAIRPEAVGPVAWDAFLGVHMREHLSDAASDFLKEQTS